MTMFDEREKAFENKFKLDEELRFKVDARRAKLMGLWAAAQMGMSGDAATDYAKSAVSADLEQVGHDDLKKKIIGDLMAKGITVTAAEWESAMEQTLAEATRQIMAQ